MNNVTPSAVLPSATIFFAKSVCGIPQNFMKYGSTNKSGHPLLHVTNCSVFYVHILMHKLNEEVTSKAFISHVAK